MKCEHCQYVNEVNYSFCENCGVSRNIKAKEQSKKIGIISLLITLVILGFLIGYQMNGEDEGNEEKVSSRVSEYDKLMIDAKYSLNSNDMEKAKDFYVKALTLKESEELHVKIDNLTEYIRLKEEALFDYYIQSHEKRYEVLIHADNFQYEVPSFDDGTSWACASDGEEIYEGYYSFYVRERDQTSFSEYYLGYRTFNMARKPVETAEFNKGKLIVISECEASAGGIFNLYSIINDEITVVPVMYDGEESDQVSWSINKFKDYNPLENKFQTIGYSNVDGGYAATNFTYDEKENIMYFESSIEMDLDDQLYIEEWRDGDRSFYFRE